MTHTSLAGVIPRLRRIALKAHEELLDADLLRLFAEQRDQAAFEVLVRRHGPMVFGVCRRMLGRVQDAEDAFQATFLVLACKADALRRCRSLAAWLHGTARNTALKARSRAARAAAVENQAPAREAAVMDPESNWEDLVPILDREIAALPDRYRLPILLCDLEGKPRSEAAALLGKSEGTLSSNLTRGRRLLADRLRRSGVALSIGAMTTLMAGRGTAAVPELLFQTVVPVAAGYAADPLAPFPSVSSGTDLLTRGVLNAMFLKKLTASAVVAIGAALVVVLGLCTDVGSAAPVPRPRENPPDEKLADEELAEVNGRILMNRKVLRDIKCNIDQLDQILDALEDAERKAGATMHNAMIQLKLNPNAGQNPQQFEQMMKDAQESGEKEFRDASRKIVTKLLSAPQQRRLREVDLQARGAQALTLPSVVKALKLTAAQKEKIATHISGVDQALMNKQFPIQPDGGFDFEKVMRELRAEALKLSIDVLNDEQKAVWKKMVGEPCKFPLPAQHGFHGSIGVGGGIGIALPAPNIKLDIGGVPAPMKP